MDVVEWRGMMRGVEVRGGGEGGGWRGIGGGKEVNGGEGR